MYSFDHIWLPIYVQFQTKFLEEIKKHILFSVTFFFRKSCLYEIMWKNTVDRDRSQMTIRRTRIAFWIPKATNTHSHYCLLFHCNNGCTKGSQFYKYTVPSVFVITDISFRYFSFFGFLDIRTHKCLAPLLL